MGELVGGSERSALSRVVSVKQYASSNRFIKGKQTGYRSGGKRSDEHPYPKFQFKQTHNIRDRPQTDS